jgi:hypothetical protein
MSTTDKQIAEILATYGEPLAGNVWRVQGTAVIYHKALERIAVQARIRFEAPQIIRAERDEAVILATGHMPGPAGERTEWSIGEALVNVNYRISGKQAGYVYAMAEKRAKDRVILKLVGLHGLLYSEDEADEFKEASPAARERRQQAQTARQSPPPAAAAPPPAEDQGEDAAGEEAIITAKVRALKQDIGKFKSINDVTDYMLSEEVRATLESLPAGFRDDVREHAKARLVSLGWVGGKSRRPPPANANEAAEAADRAGKLAAAEATLEEACERAETDDEITAARDEFRAAVPKPSDVQAKRVNKILADARARLAQTLEAAE